MRRATSLLAAVVLLACGPDPSLELKKDIERLKAERVEARAVEKARAELAEFEPRIDAAHRTNEEKAAALPPLERKRDAMKAAAAAERTTIPVLEAEQQRALEAAKDALETAQELDQRIARARARAGWAHDQLGVVLRELRPNDPSWATERRLGTLRELMDRLHKEWSADPVLANAAAELVAVGRPEVPAAKAREVASRISERFTGIYELRGEPAEAPVAGSKSE